MRAVAQPQVATNDSRDIPGRGRARLLQAPQEHARAALGTLLDILRQPSDLCGAHLVAAPCLGRHLHTQQDAPRVQRAVRVEGLGRSELNLLYHLFFEDKMQNEDGDKVDLYIPRKCSATNRLITAKDHASVQINVGHVNSNGVYTGEQTSFALCGFIREKGASDDSVNRLCQNKGFLKSVITN